MAKLVSKTYGDALFELAVDTNQIARLQEESEAILQIFQEHPDYARLLRHPKISKEDKKRTIEEIFQNQFSREMVGFLSLLASKERTDAFEEVLRHFIMRVKEHLGIGVAYVTTALPLREDQKVAMEEKLLSTTSFTSMEIHYEVEPSIIGGVLIRIGDRVVDSSIRNKLNRLERELLQVQI